MSLKDSIPRVLPEILEKVKDYHRLTALIVSFMYLLAFIIVLSVEGSSKITMFALMSTTMIFCFLIFAISHYLTIKETQLDCPLQKPGFDLTNFTMTFEELVDRLKLYQDEKRITESLFIQPIFDSEKPYDNLLNRVISYINEILDNAKKYEIYVIKYGLGSFEHEEYLEILSSFLKKGGNITLIIPTHTITSIREYSQVSKNKKLKNKLLKLYESSGRARLVVYQYDSSEFEFLENLKIGLFAVTEDEEGTPGKIQKPDVGYFSLKSDDGNHSLSYFVNNKDFVSYLLKNKDVMKESPYAEQVDMNSLLVT